MTISLFKKTALATALFCGLAIVSCKKNDNPTPAEIITTVQLTFTELGTTDAKIFTFEDLDGDGGTAPVIDKIVLGKDKTYDLKVEFFDKTKSPAEDITTEVAAESDVHLVTFGISGANLTFTYADKDVNDKPVGLLAVAKTGAVGTGNLNLVLHHEPTSKDDLANPGGESDVDVNFVVEIN